MITKMNKNVLLVQDVPSNLIDEVILILKTENKPVNNKTKEILMLEANEIIQDCSIKLQSEYDAIRKAEREKQNRKQRIKMNILTIAGFALFTFAIVLLVNLIK